MAVLPIHNYFSLNGVLTLCNQFIASENEGGVYEVLRVIDGIPLFLEDHLDRFYLSAEIAGRKIIYTAPEIKMFVADLIQKNKISNGNILISSKVNLKAFFIPHTYPDETMYREGVLCGLLHAERSNPNAKVFQTQVRNQANALIQNEGFYEVLLVDHSGLITEGSRSNVFFIRGNQLVTPPAEHVLLGITRQKTIKCANILKLECLEEKISLQEINQFDALFITGTSPKILPVKQIHLTEFDVSNSILRKLMSTYDTIINDYLVSTKNLI